MRERALGVRHRGRLVRVHVAQREYAVVQRVRVRAARAPRAPPPHLVLFREHLLRVKREPSEPHMAPPPVRYHELHCKKHHTRQKPHPKPTCL